MSREIKLNGGEITVLKAIGMGGMQIHGKMLKERVEDMVDAEFIDTLDGLMSLGYILSSKVNVRTMDDVERSFFRVNQSYARDLKDAVNPSRSREDRGRRQRRR